jgi:hypothetical protein
LESTRSYLDSLSVGTNLDAVLEPLDVAVLLVELDREHNVFFFHHILPRQHRLELDRVL